MKSRVDDGLYLYGCTVDVPGMVGAGVFLCCFTM